MTDENKQIENIAVVPQAILVSSSGNEEAKKTRLQNFKEVCHKWLYIEDDTFIDVLFGVVFANRLDAEPLWLYLVGVPGAGKTEIVQTWDGHSSIYSLTTLTPHTLISGKILDAGEQDPSLLPKLDGKVLVIKDFTVILKGRPENTSEILGQLRDAYDGESRAVFGTGKDEIYKSKFGIVAAVTEEIYNHLRLLSSLGERFLIYHLQFSEKERTARTRIAAENRPMEKQAQELKKASHDVLSMKIGPSTFPKELHEEVANLAELVAQARTETIRDRNTKEILNLPYAEVATRLVKQLVGLAQGIAMVREKPEVTKDEIASITKVAMDSIPPMRLEVLCFLKEIYPNSTTIHAIAEKIRVGDSVIKRILGDLYALRIIDKKKAEKVTDPDDWKLAEKYKSSLDMI